MHPFLKSKFQVGSAKSDRANFAQNQSVFHVGDVRKEVQAAKRAVNASKKANILETEPRQWNQSSVVSPGFKIDVKSDKGDLRRQLLKVRAGMMSEKTLTPSRMHCDERVAELQRYVVGITGQGPIGKLTGNWITAVEERGLSNHCIADHWPDWNHSHAAHSPDDVKAAQRVFSVKEERRERMMAGHPKLTGKPYLNPTRSVGSLNDRIRERKVDFFELKDQFKRELKAEFPDSSEERLQAVAQRLLNEKLLADEKLCQFPMPGGDFNFMPNVSLSTQDRRYKEYHHPGAWCWNEREKRLCWSCCLNFSDVARGCEYKVKNPDAWCVLGFERSPGMANKGRGATRR